MTRLPLVQSLENILFLQDALPKHLEQLAAVATLRDFGPQEVVFREGDAAERVYLVAAGNVSLEICAPAIGCKRILTIGPGEILGWSALFDGTRFTATARTMEHSSLVVLNATELKLLFQQNPDFGYEFTRRAMSALAKRLYATRIQLLNIFGSEPPSSVHANED